MQDLFPPLMGLPFVIPFPGEVGLITKPFREKAQKFPATGVWSGSRSNHESNTPPSSAVDVTLRLFRRQRLLALQDLGLRRERLRFAAKNEAARFLRQRIDERFRMGAHDFKVEQDHAQLFH